MVLSEFDRFLEDIAGGTLVMVLIAMLAITEGIFLITSASLR
jgi:hypothetical protein